MVKSLSILCLLLSCRGWAQCGYTATLRTNRDHCIGSSLIVTSSHAFQKIIWYRDSTAVGTATATSIFNPNPKTVAGGNGAGHGPNQFTPSSVALDNAGNIYVMDPLGYRVQKWVPGAGGGVTVAGGNGMGNAPNQLGGGGGIFVDHNGNLFIADEFNCRIQEWAPGATSGVTVAGGNGRGTAPGQLKDPTFVYVACDGNMYITDGTADRVLKWPAGASAGEVVIGQNSNGSLSDPVLDPLIIGQDGSGTLYVASTAYSGSVSVWAPGATSGVSLTTPSGPWGMWVDRWGDIFYCSGGDNQIREWPKGGSGWQTIITTNWKPGNSFLAPDYTGLWMDNRGNFYMGDEEYNSVVELQRTVTIDSSYTPTTTGVYSAAVIDFNGDTATTGPFDVNVPFTGPPPSIQVSSTATSAAVCVPITFTATLVNPGIDASYQWQVSGVNVGGDSLVYSNNLFANGDRVYCILNTDTGCTATPVSDTSNVITLSIDPQGHPTITISASDTAVCAGTPIDFTSSVQNAAPDPGLDWMANGLPVGDTLSTYVDSSASGGEVVYCLINSDASCGLAKSNSIAVTVYPLPSVAPGQVFNIPYGKNLQLDPVITGDIAVYAWSPATGLSDTAIRDPVANAVGTTVYTLSLTSFGGCKATGVITVDVYTPLSIPNAFTPNGDGRNDIFYVLGGPTGSLVKAFAVFDRWGQCVFQVKDVSPGDPAFGWNGYIHGAPAPSGAYVYMVSMQFQGGSSQTYKGAVMLIR